MKRKITLTPFECMVFTIETFLNEGIKAAGNNPDSEVSVEIDKISSLMAELKEKARELPEEKGEEDFVKLINALMNMEKDKAQDLLNTFNTILNYNARILDEDISDDAHLIQLLDYQYFVHGIANSYFYKPDFGDEPFKKCLRVIFENSIKLAESLIETDDDIEAMNFGYELKNNSLLFRSRLRQTKAKGDTEDFFREYLSLLDPEQKEFFLSEHIRGFTDNMYSDLWDGEPVGFEEYGAYCLLQQNDFLVKEYRNLSSRK